ncbi:hypothetical protein ACQEVF_59345 [Nonomuraea polychroma]|uniref:hypothetical protein n=1 Tax=Nonomuraea polychroma TaxID=46176 RepID=UPI003D8F213F
MLWTSPGGYEAVLMASGFILYRQVEEMIRIPFPMEGELTRAIEEARAAKAEAAREQSAHGESGC